MAQGMYPVLGVEWGRATHRRNNPPPSHLMSLYWMRGPISFGSEAADRAGLEVLQPCFAGGHHLPGLSCLLFATCFAHGQQQELASPPAIATSPEQPQPLRFETKHIIAFAEEG